MVQPAVFSYHLRWEKKKIDWEKKISGKDNWKSISFLIAKMLEIKHLSSLNISISFIELSHVFFVDGMRIDFVVWALRSLSCVHSKLDSLASHTTLSFTIPQNKLVITTPKFHRLLNFPDFLEISNCCTFLYWLNLSFVTSTKATEKVNSYKWLLCKL